MKRITLVLLAAVSVVWPGVASATGVALENCANHRLSAAETARWCREALRSPRLKPETRAAVLVNLGVAQAAMSDHEEALVSYSLAIETEPDLVQAYLNRATSLDALGRPREALADYDAAIRRDGKSVDAWLGRGSLLLRRGAPEEAIKDLTQAIRLAPGRSAAWFNRGLAELQIGDHRGAISDFSEVIEADPNDAEAYLNRGRAQAATAARGAERDFDRAIELAPDWAEAWVVRGRYFDQRGDTDRAVEDFRRAYELGYSQPWLLERLRNPGG